MYFYVKGTSVTKDLSTVFENMKSDNDFSFSISFYLKSFYPYVVPGNPNIISITNLFSFEAMDQDNYKMKLDLVNNPRVLSVNHGRSELLYILNFIPKEKKVEFYV